MTARFTGPLRTEQIGHQQWKITEPFSFISSTGLVVDVEAGFSTDLASIPAVTQGIISKCGYWDQAAVCHDLLYRNHRTGMDSDITRLQADDILLEGCRVKAADFSVPDSERRDWLIYGGVRIGGLSSWESPSERQARLERQSTDSLILDQ